MFSYSVMPGFSDTDALGHINNTRLPVWFENARDIRGILEQHLLSSEDSNC